MAALLAFWPYTPLLRFMMAVVAMNLCVAIVYNGPSRYGLISLIGLLIGVSHSTWHLGERGTVMSVTWVFILGWLLDRTLEWRSKRGSTAQSSRSSGSILHGQVIPRSRVLILSIATALEGSLGVGIPLCVLGVTGILLWVLSLAAGLVVGVGFLVSLLGKRIV